MLNAPGKVMAMTSAELLASNAALSSEVQRSHEALKIAQLTIDKMKVELAYLRRMKYGRSSEQHEHPQPPLELVGGQGATPEVEPSADAGEDDGLKSNVTSLERERKTREPKTRPGCASCQNTCRAARSFTRHLAAATAPRAALACVRLARTSRKFWTTCRAPSTSCATCAQSWRVRAARRQRLVNQCRVGWPAFMIRSDAPKIRFALFSGSASPCSQLWT